MLVNVVTIKIIKKNEIKKLLANMDLFLSLYTPTQPRSV